MDGRTWRFVLVALGVCLALAAFVAPFASSAPDGLDRFAEEQRIAARAADGKVWTRAPLPDYTVGSIRNQSLSTGVAGAVGTLAVFGLAFGLAKVIGRRRNSQR